MIRHAPQAPSLHANEYRSGCECVRQVSETSQGYCCERVELFGLNLLAVSDAAMDLGAPAVASIQNRPQVHIGLLCLGVSEHPVNLIVKNGRLCVVDDTNDDGRRRAD